MVSFPFCKINLGLHVLSRREDGYHNIETCFYPVPWTDVLEIIPSPTFRFTLTGISVPGTDESNSCVAAWRRLHADFKIPPVSMALHKIIPTGAGLGGGSSDGAFALKMLNEIFDLRLSEGKLMSYAAQLGSDCAFFLRNEPMIGTGRGEILHPVSLSLAGKYLVIIKPPLHVPTAEAYRGITPVKPAVGIEQILRQPVSEWNNTLLNDFESSVFKRYPAIAQIKDKLYSLGASYASMSGSGASVFAFFEHEPQVRFPEEFADCVVWGEKLL